MTEPTSDNARVSATTVAPGDILGGKYRIDGELGAGGMGVVLSATHLELDAPVAIKVMRDELSRNEEIVGRMLFEARAVAKLKSSHVVRVLDVARLESGAPYIVMERLEGRDLSKVLTERGPLPVEETVDYVLEACQCLMEAHALGIIHRDLKPENLYLAATREGNVIKVLDFGISKHTGISPGLSPRSVPTSAGYVIGSPYYMSPEQMRAADVDARADVWSLGAILYELLSGRCPFEGESLPVVCSAVLGDAEAAPLSRLAPHVPEGLCQVVARCLRKQRDARFASVMDLAVALAPFASEEGQRAIDRRSRATFSSNLAPIGDRQTATPAPVAAASASTTLLARPPKRRPWAFVAALVALLAGAVVWATLRDRGSSPNDFEAAPAVTPAAAAAAPSAPPVNVSPTLAEPPAAEPPPVAADSAKARPGKRQAPPVAAAPSAPAGPAPVVSAVPAKPVSPAAKPATDAWDPDRLGGRY
ncbi:MAG: serine/threonine protein kinase [Polyangiaceae bacterium]|nr:serine/threonine protein kinase [Polyangiaceae bacterium]